MRRGAPGCAVPASRSCSAVCRCCGEVFGPSEFGEAAGRKNAGEKKDNWANSVQLLRSAHLQSDVTAGSRRAAVCAGEAAIFSNTLENDNPTPKLKNEVEMSIMHLAVARVGSVGVTGSSELDEF